MAFADLTAYKAAIASPQEIVGSALTSQAAIAGSAGMALLSTWTQSWLAPSAPGAAAAPTRATTGALGQQNGGSGTLIVTSIECSSVRNTTTGGEPSGPLVLADRLSHQSGLSGTSVSTQTTNLPTAALTRYTTGAGVWAALEVYTTVGATQATATISYTNQAGTAGQTGTAWLGSPATAARGTQNMGLMTLASGDTGVRSVESVTLSQTTGTTGNFGVTLFKPLLFVPTGIADQYQCDLVRGTLGGGLPEIIDGACLYWLWGVGSVASTTTQRTYSILNFSEI